MESTSNEAYIGEPLSAGLATDQDYLEEWKASLNFTGQNPVFPVEMFIELFPLWGIFSDVFPLWGIFSDVFPLWGIFGHLFPLWGISGHALFPSSFHTMVAIISMPSRSL